MSAPSPVSLRDIAKVAKVSMMTVSLALRNDTSISAATRERVKQIAAEMGYKRDPLLSAYGQQIRRRKSNFCHSNIAWLFDWDQRDVFMKRPCLKRYWEGGKARASDLGCALDLIWIKEPGLDASRLVQIMDARGIRGYVLNQILHPDFFKTFPLLNYANVSIGRIPFSPDIPTILSDSTTNALITVHQLVARGFRRIGFFQNFFHTVQTRTEGLSTLYFHAHKLTGEPPLEPFLQNGPPLSDANMRAFKQWYESQRPEVIVTENDLLWDVTQKLGLRVPQDVSLVHLEITDPQYNWSGIDPLPESIGAAAIDVLTGQLFRNEFGCHNSTQSLRLRGRWLEGATCRPPPDGTAPPDDTSVYAEELLRHLDAHQNRKVVRP